MSSFGFGKLNGLQIEYLQGIDINRYYGSSGTFLATKILTKALLQFSTSGKVIYSNYELMDLFGVTRRGLQIGFTYLEKAGVMRRTFKDETKHERTGFMIDIDMAVEWLSMTREDVKDRPRGDLCKHFVMQSIIKVRAFSKQLSKLLKVKQNQNNREEIMAKLEKLNERQAIYDKHVRFVVKRVSKYIAIELEDATQEECADVLKRWLQNDLKYSLPPGASMN